MQNETNQIDYGGEEFTQEEVEARTAKILNREPRMDPRRAEEEAVKALRAKYDMLSAGAGNTATDGGDDAE